MRQTNQNLNTPATKEKRANGRGSIYLIPLRSGAKRYRAAIYDINGKLRTKNFKKKSEAEDWLSGQRHSREQGEGTYATNPKMNVADFMLGWVETNYGEDQASTKHSYLSVIKNHINPAIGQMKAASLTTKTVELLLRDMAANKSGAGTIRITRAALSAAYNDAVRLGELVRNPIRNTKIPPLMAKTTKPLPRNDWEKIYLEATKDPYMHARVEIAGMLGLRPGEARGLKWSDLDVDNETLLIERQVQRVKGRGLVTKSVKQKTARTIKIHPSTVKILLTHKRYQALKRANWAIDDDLMFTNTLGRFVDEKSDRLAFKNLCLLAGVPDYQLYQLRKTAFTNMAQQTDVRTLLAFSGHSQVSTLMGSYVFPTEESMLRAVSGMDKLRPSL